MAATAAVTATKIADYTRRPKRAAEADGLNDILSGIVLLTIVFLHYASSRFQATIHGHDFTQTPAYRAGLYFFLAAIVATFAVIFLARHGVEAVRQRFVYHRLGYTAPRTVAVYRHKLLVAAVAIAFVLLIAGTRGTTAAPLLHWAAEKTVLILGALAGGTYLIHFTRQGFLRHLIVASIALSASVLLSLSHREALTACGLLVVTLAVSLIAAGAIPFARLLRVPSPTTDQDGEAAE